MLTFLRATQPMPMARDAVHRHDGAPRSTSKGGDVPDTSVTTMAQRSRVALLGIIGADDLLGVEVVDRDGNVVGQLHDILLDLRRNRIAYGVIELRRALKDC